jgi:hypothetical protein
MEDSHSRPAACDREKTELIEALDSARESEEALEKALAHQNEEATLLKADHSKLSRRLELLSEKLRATLQSANRHKRKAGERLERLDKTNGSVADKTDSSINSPRRSSKNHRRDSASNTLKQLDTEASTASRPEQRLRPHPTPPAVETLPTVSCPPTPPSQTQKPANSAHNPERPGGSIGTVIQADIPSPKPDSTAVAIHAEAPGQRPVNKKKHARAADADDQESKSQSKRARRRKRHRQALKVGEPAGQTE